MKTSVYAAATAALLFGSPFVAVAGKPEDAAVSKRMRNVRDSQQNGSQSQTNMRCFFFACAVTISLQFATQTTTSTRDQRLKKQVNQKVYTQLCIPCVYLHICVYHRYTHILLKSCF